MLSRGRGRRARARNRDTAPARSSGLLDLLLQRLREEGYPEGTALSVAELHRKLLPYRRCRGELGYATKSEYDLAMLELLSDERHVLLEEPELGDALRQELTVPEPGLAVLQRFAAAELRLRAPRAKGSARADAAAEAGEWWAMEPDADEGRDASPRAGAGASRVDPGTGARPDPGGTPGPSGTANADAFSADAAAGAEAAGPAPTSGPGAGAGAGGAASPLPGGAASPTAPTCAACARPLPERDDLRFCPYCGADQEPSACARCGAEARPEWRFCPACGESLRPGPVPRGARHRMNGEER